METNRNKFEVARENKISDFAHDPNLSTKIPQIVEQLFYEEFGINLPDVKETVPIAFEVGWKNIKEYVGLVRSHFTDAEMSNYEQQGRAAIIESIPQLGIIPTAQENAARVLVPLITQTGYREEDIIIQFRKEYGVRDIQSLINMDIENAKK